MRLILFRHGPAEPREGYRGRPDEERPLTRLGNRSTRRAARGLARWVPEVHVIGSSPYRRCVETAEIAASCFGVKVELVGALEPGREPESVSEWLGSLKDDRVVMAVGHEPDLGELGSWFLSGRSSSFIPIKKAGALVLDLPREPGPACADLVFAMSGSQLRRSRR